MRLGKKITSFSAFEIRWPLETEWLLPPEAKQSTKACPRETGSPHAI
jgi:hypothetical protein